MLEHTFKMTSEGLECLDCPVKEEDDENEKEEPKEELKKGTLKVNIDGDGVEINVKDKEGDKAQVKLDSNEVRITDEN